MVESKHGHALPSFPSFRVRRARGTWKKWMRQYRTGLWKNSDFVKLWLGQTVSHFGSGITGIALPLTAVLVLAATPAQMGILGALDGVSVLVIGLQAGVWVDRVRRRTLLIATDFGRAFILSTIPLAALLGVLRIGQLYIVAALAGMLTVIFNHQGQESSARASGLISSRGCA